MRLEHPDKQDLVEHRINFGLRIQLHHTGILSTKPRQKDRFFREAIKMNSIPKCEQRG
jgi:hypothetical protein